MIIVDSDLGISIDELTIEELNAVVGQTSTAYDPITLNALTEAITRITRASPILEI